MSKAYRGVLKARINKVYGDTNKITRGDVITAAKKNQEKKKKKSMMGAA